MKDSGIEWIGEIPEDWEAIKMRNLGMFSSSGIDKLINPDEPMVKIINYTDVYGNKSLILNNKDYMIVSASEEKINKHSVNEGDLIFTPSSETIEDIGVSALVNENLKNTAFSYHVLRFQFNRNVVKNYKKYICNNHYVQNIFSSKATGSIRKTLKRDDFKELVVLLPQFQEQQAIANFLDQKVSEIDHILKKTRESIEEYKKYKQSLITEAVTKGLNPDVEMKDSGIEWIGEIPKHWEMVRIKTLFQEINERNLDDENAILLSLFTALGVKPRSEMEDKGNKSSTVINYKVVKKGDVIVNKLLAWMGAIAYSDYNGVTSPDYDVYRSFPEANVVQDYYNQYFRFTNFKDDCYKYGRGIMMMRWRTYPDQFKGIFVVNPPQKEQFEIVEYLEEKVMEIDSLISQKEALLSELETYKKSLIYECVTGKREVD